MTDDNTTQTTRGNQSVRCGPYLLVREIGRGGVGIVYEARHAILGRRVAVKALAPELVRNPEMLARFLREAVAAARIDDPGVVSVVDVGHEDDRAWIAMELLEGEDLKTLLDRESRLDATRAVDLLLPVLAAVATAHDAGVVHRDLKPGNVFLVRDRSGAVHPKVVDFGFSKIREVGDDNGEAADLTRPSVALGTLWYMPLEQIRASREAGSACDQYALGVTLYRCVTGELPFAGRNNSETFSAIVKGTFLRPKERVPSLPQGLDDAITRAIQARPEARHPSVRAFGAALLPFASPAARARWEKAFGVAVASEGPTRRAGSVYATAAVAWVVGVLVGAGAALALR